MERAIRETKIVCCPHCGWEYDASELVYPEDILGRPTPNGVIRDGDGKIIYREYEEECEPLAEDVYYCDHCGKPFRVKFNVEFTAEPQAEELDFSDTSASLL